MRTGARTKLPNEFPHRDAHWRTDKIPVLQTLHSNLAKREDILTFCADFLVFFCKTSLFSAYTNLQILNFSIIFELLGIPGLRKIFWSDKKYSILKNEKKYFILFWNNYFIGQSSRIRMRTGAQTKFPSYWMENSSGAARIRQLE